MTVPKTSEGAKTASQLWAAVTLRESPVLEGLCKGSYTEAQILKILRQAFEEGWDTGSNTTYCEITEESDAMGSFQEGYEQGYHEGYDAGLVGSAYLEE